MKKVQLDLKKLQLKKEKIADMISISGGMGSISLGTCFGFCDDPPQTDECPTQGISCGGTCGLGCQVTQAATCNGCG